MKPFAWRRWWGAHGLPALRVMAIEHWDPLGVYDDPSRADAYDPYLDRVGRMLRSGKGSAEIARYLGDVRTKALDRGESEATDELFADRIVAWYALEAPQA
jgi:hypothetical protein